MLIGPGVKPPPAEFLARWNGHLFGQRLPESLPGYLRALDVGVIPYKGKEFLEAFQPTKSCE